MMLNVKRRAEKLARARRTTVAGAAA
jgi:hypothetical protein